MPSVEGKVAWVTGGGSGIGRGVALALAGAGAKVVVSGRRREPLEETARLARGIEAEPCDVADAAAVQDVAARIVARHGRLDILVANAGLNIPNRRWRELTPDSWRQLIDADLNSVFYCAHAVLPQMRRQQDGLIVTISSWAGRFPSYVSGVGYSAAKHALLTMNHSLNQEECKNGIRGCAICPAEVATPILDKRPVKLSAEERARMLQPEDLGETVLFVARMPKHVCVNEILISPTWNRSLLGAPDMYPGA